MDIELSRLSAAARKLNIRITPTRTEDGNVTVTASDVRALLGAVNSTNLTGPEANQIRHLLYARRPPTDVTISGRDANLLTLCLDRLAQAVDRDARIRRGQFTGPMSGSEAVRYLRGRHGLR